MFTTFTDPHLKDAALAAGVHAVIDKTEVRHNSDRQYSTIVAE